jgi:hypothetical protein
MPSFVTAEDVRLYLNIAGRTSTTQYGDTAIGSNIRWASSFLQRRTGRQFEEQNGVTKTFTTEGRASLAIPDLRSVTAVNSQDVALTANETYYLIPDRMNNGVYTAIQFHAFGGGGRSYLSNPQWFDRNLDRDWRRYGSGYSLPNDLVITGDWGWDPLPDELLHVTKVLAGWAIKRGDAVLAGGTLTPDGNLLDYSQLPPEVKAFIVEWSIGEQAVAI